MSRGVQKVEVWVVVSMYVPEKRKKRRGDRMSFDWVHTPLLHVQVACVLVRIRRQKE